MNTTLLKNIGTHLASAVVGALAVYIPYRSLKKLNAQVNEERDRFYALVNGYVHFDFSEERVEEE